jgi:hypothetical protein
MLIKYAQFDEVIGALHRMESLTGKVGYAIMRTLDRLEPEYKIYEKLRANLIMQHAPEGKDGIGPEDPGWDLFLTAYRMFLRTEVEVEPYQIEPEEFDVDRLYCELAKGSDYKIVEAIITRRKESDGDAGESGGRGKDQTEAGEE